MRRAAAAALFALLALAGMSVGAGAMPSGERRVAVAFVSGLTYERALADPEVSRIARRGGVGLLTVPGDRDPVAAAREELAEAARIAGPDAVSIEPGAGGLATTLEEPGMLIVVVGEREAGIAPIVLARADAAEAGAPGGLTSDTTRRPGIVSTADLVPTVLEFLGRPVPPGRPGGPIRERGDPPTDLVERYRALEPLRAPAGALAFGVAIAAFLLGVVLLMLRAAPAWALRVAAFGGLLGLALAVTLLPAVLLPGPAVLPAAGAGAVLLVLIAVRVARMAPSAAVAVLGGAAVTVVLLDGVLGWPGMLMPLIGGNSLEGSRFYGLGNGYGGLLMGGSVIVASRLRPVQALAVLLAAGLLAGLPALGANFGTSFTLFAAAGLWFAVGVRRDRRVGTLALAAAIWAGGVAAILLAHRLAPFATHVTGVLEATGRTGLAGLADVYVRRLLLAVQSTTATPAAWLILAAIPAWLVVAVRRAGPFREPLERDPRLRRGAVVLALASIVGFLANDTIGVAAGGFAFLSAALLYPALELRWTHR